MRVDCNGLGHVRKSSLPLGLQTLRRELYDFDMLDERGIMIEVRIYTARYLLYCAAAKALLEAQGSCIR